MLKSLCVMCWLLILGGLSSPGFAAPDLSGRWVLNEEQSDDAHERLQGLTVIRSKPRSITAAERERAGMTRQMRVYDEVQLAKERRQIGQEADVGELARVLNAEVLAIAAIEGGFELTYDTAFTRTLKPRPGGARYSAKGDEFVADEIGRSMVYWRGNMLVVETLLAPRGTMTEEISLKTAGKQLRIHTMMRNPDWLIDADIVRVFDAAP